MTSASKQAESQAFAFRGEPPLGAAVCNDRGDAPLGAPAAGEAATHDVSTTAWTATVWAATGGSVRTATGKPLRHTVGRLPPAGWTVSTGDRKSTRLNSSHVKISYAV